MANIFRKKDQYIDRVNRSKEYEYEHRQNVTAHKVESVSEIQSGVIAN